MNYKIVNNLQGKLFVLQTGVTFSALVTR